MQERGKFYIDYNNKNYKSFITLRKQLPTSGNSNNFKDSFLYTMSSQVMIGALLNTDIASWFVSFNFLNGYVMMSNYNF